MWYRPPPFIFLSVFVCLPRPTLPYCIRLPSISHLSLLCSISTRKLSSPSLHESLRACVMPLSPLLTLGLRVVGVVINSTRWLTHSTPFFFYSSLSGFINTTRPPSPCSWVLPFPSYGFRHLLLFTAERLYEFNRSSPFGFFVGMNQCMKIAESTLHLTSCL